MKTKLTLRINKELIDNAKEYSAKSGKSISKLVTDLFTMIRNEKLGEIYEITPAVKSLKGILCGKKIDKSDYKKHLEEKYL